MDIGIETDRDVIWKQSQDKTLSVTPTCTVDGNNTELNVSISPRYDFSTQGLTDEEKPNISSGETVEFDMKSLNDFEPAVFVLEASCRGETFSKEVRRDRMYLDLNQPEDADELYVGETFDLEADVMSDLGGSVSYSLLENPSLVLGDGDSGVNLISGGYTSSIGKENIDAGVSVPESAEAASELSFSYGYSEKNGDGFVINDKVDVTVSNWKVSGLEYSPGKVISADSLAEFSVTADISYQGEPLEDEFQEVVDSDFILDGLGDKSQATLQIEKMDGESRYRISIEKAPQIEEIGTYNPRIVMQKDGDRVEIADFTVEKKFDFSGTVRDVSSRSVSTEFRIAGNGSYMDFSASDGSYSKRLSPGRYQMEIGFPETSLNLEGVKLEEEFNGNINYQYYSEPSENIDIKGIKPINMMSVSFGYPFSSGSVSMSYDPSKADDPTEVRIYECNTWNFGRESCSGEWSEVGEDDINRVPTVWDARFPVNPRETDEFDSGTEKILTNAYVVGTNSQLSFSRVQIGSYSKKVGESLEVEGRIVEEQGNAVEDVEVTGALTSGASELESTAETDSEGVFSMSFSPGQQGNYSLSLEASKGQYDTDSAEVDTEIEFFREADLSLSTGSLQVAPGENATSTVSVENTGQKKVEQIGLSVSGPDASWYSLENREVGSLEPGESFTTDLTILLPSDYCEGGCDSYPSFNFEVEGVSGSENLYDASSLQTQIDYQPEGQESDESEQQDGLISGDFSEFTPTGMASALEQQSALNIALGLITVFALVLAGAVRKKKSGGDDRRERLESMQKGSLNQAVQPTEFEEVDTDVETDQDFGETEIEDIGDELEPDEDIMDEEVVDGESGEESSEEPVCDVCGEEFDTMSALKLHRQALH